MRRSNFKNADCVAERRTLVQIFYSRLNTWRSIFLQSTYYIEILLCCKFRLNWAGTLELKYLKCDLRCESSWRQRIKKDEIEEKLPNFQLKKGFLFWKFWLTAELTRIKGPIRLSSTEGDSDYVWRHLQSISCRFRYESSRNLNNVV